MIENLDVDVLASTPFMETNDVAVRPAKRQVILSNGSACTYGSVQSQVSTAAARRALVLCAPPTSTTIWPGEFVEIELPGDVPADTVYAFEPRIDAPSVYVKRLTASQLWPCPNIVSSVAGRI